MPNTSTAQPETQRSNQEWLRLLSEPIEPSAVADLQRYLLRGLGKALATRGRVDDADLEDFAQEGTLKVLARLKQFRGDSRFTTWATSVAIRLAFTELRRRRWRDVSLDEMSEPVPLQVDETPGADEQLQQQELHQALRRAIDEVLTERQRTVILAELAGTPGVVLADRLGVQAGALYKMYHDARKKLRQALSEDGFSALDIGKEVRNAPPSASEVR